MRTAGTVQISNTNRNFPFQQHATRIFIARKINIFNKDDKLHSL